MSNKWHILRPSIFFQYHSVLRNAKKSNLGKLSCAVLFHNVCAGESFVHVTFTPYSSSGQLLSKWSSVHVALLFWLLWLCRRDTPAQYNSIKKIKGYRRKWQFHLFWLSTENHTFFYYFEATVRWFHCSLEGTKTAIK